MNERYFQSQRMKENNARKAKLRGVAYELYMSGLAGLSNAQDVADKGRRGRGFKLTAKPTSAKPAAEL